MPRVAILQTASAAEQQRGKQWGNTFYCHWAQNLLLCEARIQGKQEDFSLSINFWKWSSLLLCRLKSIARCCDVIRLWCPGTAFDWDCNERAVRFFCMPPHQSVISHIVLAEWNLTTPWLISLVNNEAFVAAALFIALWSTEESLVKWTSFLLVDGCLGCLQDLFHIVGNMFHIWTTGILAATLFFCVKSSTAACKGNNADLIFGAWRAVCF